MRTHRAHFGAFLTVLAVAGLAACGGGTTFVPASAPTPTVSSLPASAYTTATCNTTGITSANLTGGNLAGVGIVATPVVGGCSYSNNLAVVVTGATGTYSGTISLNPPAGLPAIPPSNTCATSCQNNGPPPGFATANFVPLFYVTLLLNGFTGQLSPDNPNVTATVNSITTSTNSLNFFIGSWSGNLNGTTPPAVSATAFTGWSNNDSAAGLAVVPLTVTPPNTLSLPAFPCSPTTSCAPSAFTSPLSFTLVQVVGYFT